MSEAARKLDEHYTWSDYQTWDDDQRWEILGGEAFLMSPSPTSRHQLIVTELGRQMANHFKGKPCRVFVSPMDVVLSEDDVVQPDLLVVCDQNRIQRTHIDGAPDLVVEVISESSAYRDRMRKMHLYAKAGVKEYWIVTPLPSMVDIFLLRGEHYEVHDVLGKEQTLTSPSFPELEIALPACFDFPLEPDEVPLVVKEPPHTSVWLRQDTHPMNKPNIILINCDDLGYGDLGCYGSTVHKTPHLDRLAAEGMRFTDHHVGSPVCSASRAALLTGCYPQRVGMPGVLSPGQEIGLHPDEETLGTRLKQQGYATQIVGKWHCGDQPEFLPSRFGFDHYFGIPYSNDMGRQVRPNGEAIVKPPLPLVRDEAVIQQQPDQASLTERYMEESVRFIRDNSEGPFFLYLPHMYVHVPIYVPQRFLDENPNPYAGAVACIDWVTGVIMQELRERGLEENTLVIFTSDNGSRCDYGKSNGDLRGYKATTWEGGQRVDCIMRWPGQIPAGTVCDEMTTAMDFLPTFDTLVGNTAPPAKPIDGKDITPLMRAEAGATSPHEGFAYYRDKRLNAVRQGDWKLHFHAALDDAKRWDVEPANLLYNLAEDPNEQTDLYAQHPGKVAELTAFADRYRRELGDSHSGNEEGEGCREPGRVANAKPLTVYDENYPYYMAEYDLPQCG